MDDHFEDFTNLIELIKDEEIEGKFKQVYKGLRLCGSKIISAVKFIDYFVHDILDYTILNKQEKNFTKNNVVLDVREAINEIMEIMNDKIEMKAIEI